MSTVKRRYGWKRDLPDPRDRSYNDEFVMRRASELPAKVSLRSQMPPVYDQGQLRSCTANGNGAVFEAEQMKQGEGVTTPSRLFIYYNEREREGTVDSDSGAQVRTGIKVLAAEGAPPESEWPYDISRFTEKPPAKAYADAVKHEAIAYHRIEAGGRGSPIRTALAEGKPIVFGFSVPERFEDPSWDPATEPLELPSGNEGFVGGHCVVLTGYDFTRERFPFDLFEVRNSWGAGWGSGGYFEMRAAWCADHQLGLSDDFWVVSRTT